jgi:hypothetical protein
MWLDDCALGLVEFFVGEALEHAALHIDRRDHERSLAAVERSEVAVARECGRSGSVS